MLIPGKVSAPSPGGKRTQLRTSLSLFLSARGEAEMSKEMGKKALHWVPCVLRDAPRLCRVVPQHEGMLLLALRKTPHPEAPRE
ncbi:MAG TPA: hypothetical protein VJ251_16225, partial [Stellaceae bacterium]|nr:hypothetical protein [Stellaceae bacterium]